MRTYSPVLSVAALALLAPLSLVVLNLADPPLKPEVRKILDAPVPAASEAATHAYAFLLGVLNGERADPERRGTELLSAPTRHAGQPWHVDFDHCGGDVPHPCWVDDLSPEVEAAFQAGKEPLDLYLRLMAYGDFASLARPTAERVFDPVSMPDPRLHRLFTLKLASWVKSGGEVRAWHLLQSSTQFYAAVLRRGDTMISRLIALIALGTNAQVIEREMARRPRWTPPAELVAAFDLPDVNDLLGSALEDETRIVHQMVRSMAGTWRRALLRPNETMNRFYDVSSQLLFTDCREPTVACVPALADIQPGFHLHLVNQVGRGFLPTVVVDPHLRAKIIMRMQNILSLKEKFRAARP